MIVNSNNNSKYPCDYCGKMFFDSDIVYHDAHKQACGFCVDKALKESKALEKKNV